MKLIVRYLSIFVACWPLFRWLFPYLAPPSGTSREDTFKKKNITRNTQPPSLCRVWQSLNFSVLTPAGNSDCLPRRRQDTRWKTSELLLWNGLRLTWGSSDCFPRSWTSRSGQCDAALLIAPDIATQHSLNVSFIYSLINFLSFPSLVRYRFESAEQNLHFQSSKSAEERRQSRSGIGINGV